VGSKRCLDAVPVSPLAPELGDVLAKRPRHVDAHEEDVPVSSLLRGLASAAAGDDEAEDADAIRFLRTHSVTWQQESEGESAAGWRLCVHPFLGSDISLSTCFRLLGALAALLSEEPRPLSLFHCRTQPFFTSIASFSLADCAAALEITEYAQLPKVLHDRIVDHAVVRALGQVVCTPDPPEGPSWYEQCHFNIPTVGSLERAVAALVPDRLVAITLAGGGAQPDTDASRRSQSPTGSDAEILANRVLRGINARAFEALAQLIACGRSPDSLYDAEYRVGLWGQPCRLDSAPTQAFGSGDPPVAAATDDFNPRAYRSFLMGRILSGRPIPAGREINIWHATSPPSDLAVAAAARGQVHTLQLLRLRGTPFTADAFTAAAAAGCVESIMLLWNGNCPITAAACAAAAGAGRLEVLQWMRTHGCPWDENVCIRAVRAGHLAVVQWAAAAGCPCDAYTLNAAIAARQVDAIRWLCLGRDIGSLEQRARILEEALRGCDGAMIKLAHELDVPFTERSLDAALECREKHGLRCLRAAKAAGYDLITVGLATVAAGDGDRQLLRLAHAWGAEPDPAVLAAAARTDDLTFVQEVIALGHPITDAAAESAAAAGAFRAYEWLVAAGCQKRPLLYVKFAEGSGMGFPEFTDAPPDPSKAQISKEGSGGTYQHARFHAKQLQLMQSLHAEGVPLPSDGQLWRALVPVADSGMPTDGCHPVLPWLLSIGYPFPTSLVDCAHGVGEALKAEQYGLLLYLREIKFPAAEGPHLWRSAARHSGTPDAQLDAIDFLLSEGYPLPQPPGTRFTAAEFDVYAAVAEHAPIDGAREMVAALSSARYPPSRTAIMHAAARGERNLAGELRDAGCSLKKAHAQMAWSRSHRELATWLDRRGRESDDESADRSWEDSEEDSGVEGDAAGAEDARASEGGESRDRSWEDSEEDSGVEGDAAGAEDARASESDGEESGSEESE